MTAAETKDDGWNRAEEHVTATLERLEANDVRMLAMLGRLREDVATLKVKAGVWGALAAMIPVTVMIAVLMLKG